MKLTYFDCIGITACFIIINNVINPMKDNSNFEFPFLPSEQSETSDNRQDLAKTKNLSYRKPLTTINRSISQAVRNDCCCSLGANPELNYRNQLQAITSAIISHFVRANTLTIWDDCGD